MNMFEILKHEMKLFWNDEDGLTTAEWVILGSAIAIVAMAVIGILIPKIRELATETADKIDTYDPDAPAASE
jgi:Flp pilus assembly pilin Flp